MVSFANNLNSYKRAPCGRAEKCHDPWRKSCQERRSSCQQLVFRSEQEWLPFGHHMWTRSCRDANFLAVTEEMCTEVRQPHFKHVVEKYWRQLGGDYFWNGKWAARGTQQKEKQDPIFEHSLFVWECENIFWKRQWKWQDVNLGMR